MIYDLKFTGYNKKTTKAWNLEKFNHFQYSK